MSSDSSTKCPVCLEGQTSVCHSLYDDRYGYPGSFTLLECDCCGHKFLDASFEDNELQDLYSTYYPRATFKTEQYQPCREAKGFQSWMNGERGGAYSHVPVKVHVLDIGCGFCETLGYHENRGCEAYGVEVDVNVKDIAMMHNLKVHIGVFNPENYSPAFFDYVTMDQVIEHLSDPLATLKGVALVLKTGGLIVLSTPNVGGWGARIFGRRWINWHAPYHLNFFSARSMAIAVEKVGLHLEHVKTITSSEWLLYQWNHLVTFPRRGQPSQFWSPLSRRGFTARMTYVLLKLIHLSKFNHIITRFFDTLGWGDSRLYFLRKK